MRAAAARAAAAPDAPGDPAVAAGSSSPGGTLPPDREEGETIIHRGTKIDNLCHIAHGSRIGPHASVVACAEIGAEVKIGEGAWFGPNSSSLQRLTVGKGAYVGLGAVVTRDVPDGEVVAGSPAEPMDTFKQQRRALKKLAGEGE